jgi:hypothetical protein
MAMDPSEVAAVLISSQGRAAAGAAGTVIRLIRKPTAGASKISPTDRATPRPPSFVWNAG